MTGRIHTKKQAAVGKRGAVKKGDGDALPQKLAGPQGKKKDVPSRFRDAINHALAHAERRSFSSLAKATKVSRHKLKAIADGENIPLYLSELYDLDRWLSFYNLDLLVKPTSVFRAMASCHEVQFLIPYYFDEARQRQTSSHFDVLAMAEMVQQLAHTPSPPDTSVTHVSVDEDNAPPLQSASPNTAVVIVGSLRAYDICGVVLEKMFFEDRAVHGRPPFGFVWPSWPPANRRPSHFALDASEIISSRVRGLLAGEKGRPGAWGFVYQSGSELKEVAVCTNRTHGHREDFPASNTPGRVKWESYGVLAAQWRKRQLYVVCAGMSGPDTLAIAQSLKDLSEFPAPPPGHEQNSNVVWYVVTSTIEGPKEPDTRLSDDRKILETKVTAAHYWNP